MITYAFAWAKENIMYYLETIVVVGLKLGLSIEVNELYKSRKENPQKLTQLSSRSHPRHEYQRSRSLVGLGQKSLRFQN